MPGEQGKTVTHGLILRDTDTKETDKILTVLTAGMGKISVIARGARRKNSRLAAACQLFAWSEMTLYRRGNWYYLDAAEPEELFSGLQKDLVRLSLAAYLAELTEFVAGEETEAGELLRLLLNGLYALGNLGRDPALVKPAFTFRLLALAGFEPLCDGCAVCGTHNPKEPVFDAQQGVLLCKECADHGGGGLLPLDAGSFAAMRHVLFSEPKRMLSFSLSGETEKRFAAACEVFAQVQLDRRFKTLDFYKSMKIDN